LVSVNPLSMKKFAFLLLTVIPAIAFAQIGAKTQQNKIFGVWQNSSNGQQITLILNADGRGEFDGSDISFTTQGNKLSITSGGSTTSYTYTLAGNSLTVSGGDIDGKVVFIRSAGGTEPTQNAPVVKSTPSTNTLVGIWLGNNETVEFTKANQCVYQGQVFPYQLSGNTITIQTAQGNGTMQYAVNGNQLALTINGQTFYYAKNGATPDPSATASINNTNSTPSYAQPSGNGNIAQELVGKWCYVNVNSYNNGGSSTEQCITLNANGTYEYYSESSRSVNTNAYAGGTNSQGSDRGTWSYDGSRIHYNSSMGNGSGSYLLEKRNHPKNNDPMIVLDGQTYVTQYQKAPWR
jgi:hypothetical protein